MLLDVRDKAYMLHYIRYRSEEYKVCYQGDEILHPSQEDTYQAISGNLSAKFNRELLATLLNAIEHEIIQIRDSDLDSDQPPKLPEIGATTD